MALSEHHLGNRIRVRIANYLDATLISHLRAEIEQRTDFHGFPEDDIVHVTKNWQPFAKKKKARLSAMKTLHRSVIICRDF